MDTDVILVRPWALHTVLVDGTLVTAQVRLRGKKWYSTPTGRL
jgi:hypothetical protein